MTLSSEQRSPPAQSAGDRSHCRGAPLLLQIEPFKQRDWEAKRRESDLKDVQQAGSKLGVKAEVIQVCATRCRLAMLQQYTMCMGLVDEVSTVWLAVARVLVLMRAAACAYSHAAAHHVGFRASTLTSNHRPQEALLTVCWRLFAHVQNNFQQLQALVPGLLINLDKMKASDWVSLRSPHVPVFKSDM